MKQRTFLNTITGLMLIFAFMGLSAVMAKDQLAEGFRSPPDSAQPLTWWHWLDGNITSNGITADLEAMKRAGLGGAYLFNAGVGMPQGPVRFMQPGWLGMIDHTLVEAKRLGLQIGIHNCDGFSQAGGPWITPETSMKQLAWTVKEVEGPASVDIPLEQPVLKENFYRDIAVIAFPSPQGRVLTGRGMDTTLHGSAKDSELARLVDGNPKTQAVFPVAPNGNKVDFVFPTQRTVRSIVFCNTAPIKWEEDFPIAMEVSSDGSNFRRVGSFTASWDFYEGGKMTTACEDATGTVFRLTFQNPWPFRIGEMELSETARMHFGEAKAAWMRSRGHGAERTRKDAFPGPSRNRNLPPELTVAREAVTNISGKMDSAGLLKWDVPQGRWRIVRVGYTSNGHHNAPATPEGRGLECDKLDAKVVRAHLEQYVGKLKERADRIKGPLVAMEVDSWECGIQNWAEDFEKRFQKQIGYDLLQFMPALLEGWIVDSADVTERALWDWRRFLADQFNENYFSVVADVAKQKGLTYIGESAGRQQYLYDTAWMRNSAVPMGEMWNNTEPGQGVRVDNKVASSIAHTTGKRIVATEAYTSGGEHAGWDNHPFTMKPLGDKAFCAGVNQFVFHTFAHQPYSATGPGFTFASWGLNFNRGNTWWNYVHAWTEYLTRCNYLLSEGTSVCDVLFYVGEEVPNRIAWRDELHPALPAGYDFDGCDTHTLMESRVKDGRIVLPSGTEYRVLLLPNLPTMRPAVLKKIKELVDDGAIVSGPRPAQSPSLPDIGVGDETMRQLAGELWDGKSKSVLSGISFEELFRKIGLMPDFEPRAAAPDAEVLYIHRRAGDTEIYFVSNQKNRIEILNAAFRAGSRAPEYWDPATGEIRELPDFRVEGSRVHVPLRIDPFGSAFVVFRGERKPAAGRNWTDLQPVQTLTGSWQVSFPPKLGAPASATFDKLISLSENSDAGIRYFSGTATYEKEIQIPDDLLGAGRDLYLDLGEVAVMAEVDLNGKSLGVLWKPPFHVRVDAAARAGANKLVVRVTNLWRNRMIGDASMPDDMQWKGKGETDSYPAQWPDWLLEGKPRPSGRFAFCTRKDVYPKNISLITSGLIGPVQILIAAHSGAGADQSIVRNVDTNLVNAGNARTNAFAWKSEIPADCPFPRSETLTGISFTGRHSDYRCGDTFYPSWASDGNLYSPWTDGKTDGVNSGSGDKLKRPATTGHAVMTGDDPVQLVIKNTSPPKEAWAKPYKGRYPCGSLVYNGVWYYGTYCLGPSGSVMHEGFKWNWPNLGPMPGFQISRDLGKTWEPSPLSPEKPLFSEPSKFLGPVKMGAPHFVDFGKNMEHSPDGKAYLVGMGAEENDAKPRICIKPGQPGIPFELNPGCTNDFAHANLSWITADQAYLARVTPSPETINDIKAYEFFAGHDAYGKPLWTKDFAKIKPLIEWNNHMGCVTATYVPGLKKYLMCVTDGWPTVAKMDSYILEADLITGPWRMAAYMKDFGEQGYFLNFPSKFISPDGKTMWLCYSANFSPGWNGVDLKFNPPGGRYGLCLHEVRLTGRGDKQ